MAATLWLLLQADADLAKKEIDVGGTVREALVRLPAGEAAAPVVFVFHGHGGSGQNAARQFRIHKLWPEAAVIYPQGLPTPGMFDKEGKRPGWQKLPGEQDNRDLKFFDAALAWLKKERLVDEKRIFATGHSNGGAFTYLLWSERAEAFAALAPSAAGSRLARQLKPRPAMHIAGEGDTVVPFETQKRTMEAARQANGCESEGKEWAKGCTIYGSPQGAPFVSFVHPGDHKFPEAAPELIVRFFKER
jgi:polyhydroxybutyrate depolymerase